MNELSFKCVTQDCNNKPFEVSQEQFVEAEYEVHCEYCGLPCTFDGDLKLEAMTISFNVLCGWADFALDFVENEALTPEQTRILILRLNQWLNLGS